MSHKHIISISLAVTAVASGCRPAGSKSNVKTLDQMASGNGMGLYSCAATAVENEYVTKTAMQSVILPNGSKCGASTDAKCVAVKDVLSIIAARNPILVQNYFGTIGGQIKISNEAVKVACQDSFSDANSPQFVSEQDRKTIAGCWSIAKISDVSSVVALVMSEDPQAIRQGGIRIMGMFYGQAVQQMSKDASGKFVYDPNYTPADGIRKTLWDKKKELALLFLEDVRKAEVASGGKYSLDNLKSLDSNAATAVRNSVDAKSLVIDKLFADSVRLQRFVDTVMGEAFDSGFCQAAENTAANSASFKGTMDVFNGQILPELSTLAQGMGTPAPGGNQAQASNTNSASNQGFSLMGGGFFASLLGLGGMGNLGTMGNTGIYPQPGMTANTVLTNLAMNPANDPTRAGYNPSLPQAVNPAGPNYNAAATPQYLQQLAAQQAQVSGQQYVNPSQRYAQTGLNVGMLAKVFSGCAGGNCNCANGQCSNCTGGCSGGNCSCPGGCCNTV